LFTGDDTHFAVIVSALSINMKCSEECS